MQSYRLSLGEMGYFYIDYSIDLNRILQEKKPDVKEGEDIRYLLADNYPVLPAYSLPYTVNEDNEPIFHEEIKMKKTFHAIAHETFFFYIN